MMIISAIVLAAGSGLRFGAMKQFVMLRGKPVLQRALECFESHPEITEVVLVTQNPSSLSDWTTRFNKISSIASGGEKRQDSVYAGFRMLDADKTDIVLIHDGVRPFVSQELLSRIIMATRKTGAAVPVEPVEDTMKIIDKQIILKTVDRNGLFRSQTPQGFKYKIIKEALETASKENFYGTDDAALVERIGKTVMAVAGERRNIKITVPEDLRVAEAFCED